MHGKRTAEAIAATSTASQIRLAEVFASTIAEHAGIVAASAIFSIGHVSGAPHYRMTSRPRMQATSQIWINPLQPAILSIKLHIVYMHPAPAAEVQRWHDISGMQVRCARWRTGAQQHVSANSQEQVAAGSHRCVYITGSNL